MKRVNYSIEHDVSIVVNSEDNKRYTTTHRNLRLFHVEGYVVEEKYSAVTGFIQGKCDRFVR